MKAHRTEGRTGCWCGASCCCYLHPPSFCTSLPAHAPSSHGLFALQRPLAYNEVPKPPLWCEFSIFFATNIHKQMQTNTRTYTVSFSFVVPRTQQGNNLNSCIWICSYPRDWCVSNMMYWLKPQQLWCSIHESKFIMNNKPDVLKHLCNSEHFEWIVYTSDTETFPLPCHPYKTNISNCLLAKQVLKAY